MKFTTKIVAAGALISVAALSILSTIQYISVSNNVEKTIDQQIDRTLEETSSLISATINGKYALGQYISEQFSHQDRGDFDQLLNTSTVRKNFVTAGMGFESDGAIKHNDHNWIPPQEWDSRGRPWYQDAMKNNDRAITQPYRDEGTGAILISISYPVYASNELLGVSFFDVDLTSFSGLINNKHSLDTTMFIVHKNGSLISHPNSRLNGEPLSKAIGQHPISSESVITNINGKDAYLDFHRIPGEDWYVGIILDYDMTHQTLFDIRNYSVFATLIALVAVAGIFMFVLNYLTKPLHVLNDAMENVASGDGDLTKRLDTNSDEEFKRLATNFNLFVEKIQTLVKTSQATTDKVSLVTEDAQSAFMESSQLLNNQVQEVEQLATAMNEMSTTSALVAQNAQQAADSTQSADSSTSAGAELVSQTTLSIERLASEMEQAVSIVNELEHSTEAIESVVEVINSIAEQTNLLALNAAIEAARAGESGRGFAVVADEVRTLAQRTQESTNEIRQMVDKLQQGATSASSAMANSHKLASETVERAQSASEALSNIKQAVSSITEVNLQIASAAEEQSLVAEEINTNTVTIKELSQQISQRNNHTSALIDEQNALAKEQSAAMNQFKV
ncbi:methyl-accepting chemotaxis protein [Vibrio mexicanus]|uniref:methyl-accepting chemotaxis protein n=1 Tax=Vibrio mexicanus TaxID=1004326 RepID=UPI00063C805B|nr:methyl-accepting chemotaxis protein [Vibrio mexicanus]